IEARKPGAALRLRHVDGGHAEGGDLTNDIDGEMALFVPLRREGSDTLPREGERHLPYCGLLLVEDEVHRFKSSRTVGCLAARGGRPGARGSLDTKPSGEPRNAEPGRGKSRHAGPDAQIAASAGVQAAASVMSRHRRCSVPWPKAVRPQLPCVRGSRRPVRCW